MGTGDSNLDDLDDALEQGAESVVLDGDDADQEGGGAKLNDDDQGDPNVEVVIEEANKDKGGDDADLAGADLESGEDLGGEDLTGATDQDLDNAGASQGVDDELDPDAANLPYGEKIKRRINREIRLRRVAEERAARADELERQLQESETRELETSKSLVEMANGRLDSEIKDAERRLRAAKEEGNTDDEIKLGGELDALRARKREIAGFGEAVTRREDEMKAKIKQRSEAAAKGENVNPMTRQWLGRNRWFADERFGTEAELVRTLDRQMHKEGMRPTSSNYFAELDRRIKRTIPGIAAKLRKIKGDGQGHRRPAAPAGGAAPVRRAPAQASSTQSKRRLTLTRQDLTNMQNFGLDPNNPAHQKQYALEKAGG